MRLWCIGRSASRIPLHVGRSQRRPWSSTVCTCHRAHRDRGAESRVGRLNIGGYRLNKCVHPARAGHGTVAHRQSTAGARRQLDLLARGFYTRPLLARHTDLRSGARADPSPVYTDSREETCMNILGRFSDGTWSANGRKLGSRCRPTRLVFFANALK